MRDSIDLNINEDASQSIDTIPPNELPKEYQALKKHSSRFGWTRRLFSLLIREAPIKDDLENDTIVDNSKFFEGKIIRNISFDVLSPFGTNINDPDREEDGFNFINNLHSDTRESTIRNILQFKEGQTVNPTIITTSEAELRNKNYIRDARIFVDSISSNNDSVDVRVIVRDKWTIGVNLHRLSSRRVNFELFDKNILGTGSRVGLDFMYSNQYDRKFGLGGNYLYENIGKTNINLEGNYKDRIRDSQFSIAAIRPLQPKLNYFGEISYKRNILKPDRIDWDSITPDHREMFSVTLGRAFTLSEEGSIRRFAVSLRYKINSPKYKKSIYKDYIDDKLVPYKFTRNKILLLQLSLYQNSYLRNYMVYNFGDTEDIPQGYNISAQFGYSDFSHIKDALYSSLSLSYGSSNIIKGNIHLHTAISSFYSGGKPFGGVFRFDSRYFSPLFKFSGLRFRQFLSLNYSKILHPDRYLGDRIYMGEHTSLKMRDWRYDKKGVEQLLFKSETDMFSNYEVAGFRFLFYSFFDMGWIKKSRNLFTNNNFNYGIGVGIRLQNNFIVFNTIDLKIGFYPKLDQSGFNSFFKVRSSTPDIPPNFVPMIPEEIMLERE